MATSLMEALESVELAAGQTYRCQVRGQLVEVRVLGPVADSCLDRREMMLDAWVELPPPSPAVRLRARPGKLPPPDAPFIPRDEESR
jgi:hypothetical protein